jgi:regulator of sigma E protease
VGDILGSLSNWIIYPFAYVLALSIIVAVHEYGHYIVGRWSGIHAEVFSLGFGKVIASRVDKRGTRWQLAAVPMGGFVKFMGDADAASVEKGALDGYSQEERRRTMAGAPLWARSLTVLAGPVANFLLGFLIIAGFLWFTGVPTDSPVVREQNVTAFSGQTLLAGDKVVAIEGIGTTTTDAYMDARKQLPRQALLTWTVERDGSRIDVEAPHPAPPLVGEVLPMSAASDAGLQSGDMVLSVDGTEVMVYEQLPELVNGSGGKPLALEIWRDGETFSLTVEPRRRDLPLPEGGFETRWLLGLSSAPLVALENRTPGPIETITLAAEGTWDTLVRTLSLLWHIVAGKISTCNLSGPIGMAEVLGDAVVAGPDIFVQRLAMLSLSIGLLNLFPIPVLDGGHLVFHAYEAVMGRAPADRVLRVMMTVGLTVLIAVMAFALSNDLFCV